MSSCSRADVVVVPAASALTFRKVKAPAAGPRWMGAVNGARCAVKSVAVVLDGSEWPWSWAGGTNVNLRAVLLSENSRATTRKKRRRREERGRGEDRGGAMVAVVGWVLWGLFLEMAVVARRIVGGG